MLRLIRWYFEQPGYDLVKPLTHLLNSTPRLCILIADLAGEEKFGNAWIALLQSSTFPKAFLTALIQFANFAPGLATSFLSTILEKAVVSLTDCFDFILSIAMTVRSLSVATELITILHDYLQQSFAHSQPYLNKVAQNNPLTHITLCLRVMWDSVWCANDIQRFITQVLPSPHYPFTRRSRNRWFSPASIRSSRPRLPRRNSANRYYRTWNRKQIHHLGSIALDLYVS